MSKKLLFALWGGLFILCAGLGFIPGFSQNVSAKTDRRPDCVTEIRMWLWHFSRRPRA